MGVGNMMDLVIIILIIFWVILIADIILTFRGIRNNHKRFDKLIIKMKWDKPGRTTLKTNISFLNSELNILLHNGDASEEVIYSVNREISMLHRKLSLINNTNLVQKVGDNDFQRKNIKI